MRILALTTAMAALVAFSVSAQAALTQNSLTVNALVDNAVQMSGSPANGAAEIVDITLANGEVLAK